MLYELPLTWYVHKKRWDLSPGYREFGNLRFSRYATAKCLACHNSYLEESPTADERYLKPFPLAIGCERCHGPGELHVRQKMGEELADLPKNARTIVNPRKLSPQRKLDVCQQCHLQGKAWSLHGESEWFDFRPAQLLESHRSVYFPTTTRKEVFEVADSPHRLSLSPCFKQSKGALTCITCHDPHRSIKTFTIDHYNEKCLTCHAPQTLPGKSSRFAHSGTDNCVSCHMNRTGTDNTLHGVSNTDHWIRIDANQTVIDWSTLKQPPNLQPLISLADVDANDEGVQVRKGIAFLDYYTQHDRRRAYLDSALSYLSEGLSHVDDDARGFFHLGEVRIALGEYDEAIASLERAVDLRPAYAEAYAKLGWVYSTTNKFETAIRYYRQALELKPDEPRYLESLGMVLTDADYSEEAVKVFENALRLDKQSPYTYYYLGNLYVHQLRLPEKAITYYRELVVLDPDFPNGFLNLGSTYGLLGNYKEAISAYEKELYIRPRSPLAFFNLGRVYMLMGRRPDARDAFRKALEIDPSMILAERYLNELER